MNLKIKFENDIVDLLEIYNKYSYEVGGMIFGKTFFNNYFLRTLSLKKGDKASINFNDKDKRIYDVPDGLKILGTWHFHPMQEQAIPSPIDLKQWKKWKRNYIHIICTKKDFKIFNSRGEKLYEHFLEQI